MNVDQFLKLVRKYTDIQELTAEIVREFIDRVYVYKKESVDGHRVRRIRIVYNSIGEFTAPKDNGTEKTAQPM